MSTICPVCPRKRTFQCLRVYEYTPKTVFPAPNTVAGNSSQDEQPCTHLFCINAASYRTRFPRTWCARAAIDYTAALFFVLR